MNRNIIAALAALSLSLLVACGEREPAGESTAAAERPEHAEEHAEEGHIELSAEAAQAAGIEIAQAGPARIRELLPLYGTVRPNAERVREVSARYPGIIRSVSKKVGDAVREGETLATVESNESLRTYSVTAPMSGVITARNANPGENAGEASLFTVADLSTVWVELAMFPRDSAKIRTGHEVAVRSVDGGPTARGTIVYVSPLGQAGSQTLTARVQLQNREGQWAPGLYVIGEVALSETDVLVAVESTALQTLEGRSVVFVQTDDGFKAELVEIGRRDSEFSEVRSGVAAGARYAAANSFVLKSELGKGEAGHDH